MSYTVIHTVEDREMVETPEGLVSAPKKKPYIVLLNGFAMKYVPDSSDRTLSGWEIFPVDRDVIMDLYGISDADLEPRDMEKTIEFGGDKLLRVPKMFTIVNYQSVCYMEPRWEFWKRGMRPDSCKLPVLFIERDEYPLIMDETGEIKVVPIDEISFYEKA